MRTFWMQALALPAVAAVASAQVPAGNEFPVNTYTTGYQATFLSPGVRSAPNGDFIFVWHGNGPSGYGVSARRFDAAGALLGSELRVNTSLPAGWHHESTLAVDGRGDFVVVWSYQAGYTGFDDVFARRFDHTGSPQGLEFRVNTFTTMSQREPSVASDRAGNFVVVWTGYDDHDGSQSGVFGQRYDASGTSRGAEFRVNTYTTGNQDTPSITADGTGNFVVTWKSRDQDGAADGVFAQRFAADGTRRGAEFGVNTYTSSLETWPRVAADRAGNFVVIWTDYADGDRLGVMGRRYDAAGAPQGAEFRVNSYTTGRQWISNVDSDEGGNFVVTWASEDQDGDQGGIFAQRFDASGQRRGAEFRVNSSTTSEQLFTGVSSDSVGNFSIVWSSIGQDGDGFGLFAQRFGGLVPAPIAVDTVADADSDGNGVLEAGETVDVRPAWRNVSGAAQTFSGTLTNIAGPPGATHAITDAAADYGTVPDGTTGPCIDCYEISVSNPPDRPVVHWDASAVEGIVPDTQGQQKQWLLHVGHSFVDVPTTSPFYRFIETLLHHGITAGCFSAGGAALYCPEQATLREEMAVFVLVAREGVGYAPPACGAPMFADVPADNHYCAWIEELARRGVVSGCGGGNYCPSSPVTREQMAVFVLRTLDPALSPPVCTAPIYSDVPASSPFCPWIEELTLRGVVSGCGGGNYCPTAAVTREQMGVFISVTFGLTLYGP